MRLLPYVSYFLGGIFLGNAIPHSSLVRSAARFKARSRVLPVRGCPPRSTSDGRLARSPSATCWCCASGRSICATRAMPSPSAPVSSGSGRSLPVYSALSMAAT
jgi:hypothetical protein